MALAPELRQLRHFLAVAERLNFTRAAADLSIAQQGLSSSIRQLEAMLGVRVFERSTREVRLTAAGRALLPEARRTVAQADRAVEAVRRAARGETDELGIGYVPAGGVDLVGRVIARFCAVHPGVRVSARELWASEIAAAVRDRRLDVGFTRFAPDGDGIRSEVVAEDEVVAVLPAAHPARRRRRDRPCRAAGRDAAHPTAIGDVQRGHRRRLPRGGIRPADAREPDPRQCRLLRASRRRSHVRARGRPGGAAVG